MRIMQRSNKQRVKNVNNISFMEGIFEGFNKLNNSCNINTY